MSNAFLNIHGAVKKTGLSKSRIYQLVRLGKFPRPRKVEDGRVAWLESLIDAWIAERWETAPAAGTVIGAEWAPSKKAA